MEFFMNIYSQSKARKMIKFLVLVALVALASAATLSGELARGSPWSPTGRIVGGEATTIEEVPHQISLRSYGSHSCGGSIISEYWIVTAAHCVGRSSGYSIRAGSTNRNYGGSTHTVAEIIAHEDFGVTGLGVPFNDIAIIRVNEPFELDATRQPIELFNADEETPVDALSVITGWGSTGSGGLPLNLQTVSVPIISKAVCDNAYRRFGGLPAGQICAAYPEGGKDACQGDSGGPLSVNGRLAGIVSWGNGCAQRGYPGAYTEVAAFREWIRINTGL